MANNKRPPALECLDLAKTSLDDAEGLIQHIARSSRGRGVGHLQHALSRLNDVRAYLQNWARERALGSGPGAASAEDPGLPAAPSVAATTLHGRDTLTEGSDAHEHPPHESAAA